MKIFYKITSLFIFIACYSLIADWNPFNGDDWKDLGNKIKQGVETAGDKVKEGINKGIDKTKACAEVVALGSEWAAKQAGLQTAKGVLEASEKLQKADPRLVGLLTAEKSAEAAFIVAQGTLDVAQKTSEGIAQATKIMGDIASEGFSIDGISFKTTSEDLMASKPLPITITGTLLGKNFDTTMKNVDFSNADSFVSSILKNLNV